MDNQESERHDRSAVSLRTLELIVAAIIFALGAIVIYDSVRIGMRWAEDGPQSGYFPFYVGLFICVAAGITFVRGLNDLARRNKAAVTVGGLVQVLRMLVPTALYVVLVQVIGIYVASTLYLGFFMRWLGRYSWVKVLPVAVGVSVAFYLLFEVWFKVPLPKGPLESWLGLD